MKFLVIGLGSMGKRRIRCLKRLGQNDIFGFDVRHDRCEEVHQKYQVPTFEDWNEAQNIPADAWIISTPPDLHTNYALMAVQKGIHFFTEASVCDDQYDTLIEQLNVKKVVGFPSCTMRYFPGPSKIKELIDGDRIGTPLSFTYQSGQYLPDWHPWEDYRTFYVSKKETGACREIVPFELEWLTWVFGWPTSVTCMKDKLGTLENDIDDIYQLLLKFGDNMIGHLMVDVISRPAVRHIRIIGSKGTIEWIHSQNIIRVSNEDYSWETINLDPGKAEKGYISPEEPYDDEVRDFIETIQGKRLLDFTFEDDHRLLKTLYGAEAASNNLHKLEK